MVKILDIKRKRISVLVNVWSAIVKDSGIDRDRVVEILRKEYESMGIEPIRGSSKPPDIYDKEMISLYIIGKWGLGIDRELDKEFMERIFSKEIAIERVIEGIRNSNSFDELCRAVGDICSSIDDGFIARILRFAFTLYYFGFIDNLELISILRKSYSIFVNNRETIQRFVKFYIAYEIGQKIASKNIRNSLDLNMNKNLLALEIGIPKTLPSTSYIAEVAKHFFNLPQDFLNSLKMSSHSEESNRVVDND